jgi:4-diphosphocytidyl-2-C-methyl-D-erythritol kinase
MRILSPAKINLMLRILGRRTDGYHLLQTYFQLLNWGDFLYFDVNSSDEISIEGDFGNLKLEDNLIYKAASLLFNYRSAKKGVSIVVDKNIPQGSGLGGGSSNAGTTLRILNQLWDCRLSQKELLKLALTLGADVPLFVYNQSAMATGIGEKLQPYQMKKQFFVLIFPHTGIATVDVFNDKKLDRNQKPIELTKIQEKSNWTNACLPVVLKNYPEVDEMYQHAAKIVPVYMSGTGSTLFSCFENQKQAEEFMQQCPSRWKLQLCQSKING